jgi:hypothetical protein
MIERLEGDLAFAGRCYHELFRGNDTDEAEAAAAHIARTSQLITMFLTTPQDGGRR